MDKLLLSAEEAAEALGIGRAMMYDLILSPGRCRQSRSAGDA